jgi:hypothetical protein
VFPAANHLRAGADWTGLNNYLGNAKKPLVILGLGAQSPSLGGEAATIAALKADPHVRRLADILRERAVFVSVRGRFSQEACEALGIPGTEVLGCPSALLNPDPHLGRALETRLALLRADLRAGRVPRLAMTAAAPFEIREDLPKRDLERRLFGWTLAADGLYVQQSGGLAAMNATNGHWYRLDAGARRSIAAILAPETDPLELWAFLSKAGRFFLGVPDWMEAMRSRDLVLGTRLHGTMAALAAGVPGAIIAHDSRTDELAETMHLPRLSMADAMASPGLGAAVDRIRFDGAAFDDWRARAARATAAAFDRIGMPLAAPVRALARQQTG